jgi:peptidoglycan/LPS O-acetylase OafA/YrhL
MKEIKPLTSLRFVFAMLVFVHHFIFLLPEGNDKLKNFYQNYFFEGYIGVSFFFILSGFILTYVYVDLFKARTISVRKFYLRRFARIYPLHFILLMVFVPFSLDVLQSNPVDWVTKFCEHLLLVQSFVPNSEHYFSFNMVAWSISNEMFFYALFPFIVIPLTSLNKRFIVPVIFFMLLVIGVLMHIVPKSHHHAIFYIHPFLRLPDFILGILLFSLARNIQFNSFKRASVWEIAIVAVLCIQYLFADLLPMLYRFSIYYWVTIGILIVVFSKSKGVLSALLSHKVMVYLGHISFSFYMTHVLIIKIIEKSLEYTSFFGNPYFAMASAFVLTLIASIISYEMIEKRVQKVILKRFQNRYSLAG